MRLIALDIDEADVGGEGRMTIPGNGDFVVPAGTQKSPRAGCLQDDKSRSMARKAASSRRTPNEAVCPKRV